MISETIFRYLNQRTAKIYKVILNLSFNLTSPLLSVGECNCIVENLINVKYFNAS